MFLELKTFCKILSSDVNTSLYSLEINSDTDLRKVTQGSHETAFTCNNVVTLFSTIQIDSN